VPSPRQKAPAPDVPAAATTLAPRPEAAKEPPAAGIKREAPIARLKVPSYLLEGDEPTPLPPEVRQTLHRAAEPARISPTQVSAAKSAPHGEPTTPFSTRVDLVLTARDPHCLYAFWDLNEEQLRRWADASADGHLVLRIHRDHLGTQPITEVHLTNETRHCFVHVAHAGARYRAEIGFYQGSRRWHGLAASGDAVTPPGTPTADQHIRFAVPEFPPPPKAQDAPPGTAPWHPVESPRAARAPAWVHSVAGPGQEDQVTHGIHFGAPGTEPPSAWADDFAKESAPGNGVENRQQLTEVIEKWVRHGAQAESIAISELAGKQLERPIAPLPGRSLEGSGPPSSLGWQAAAGETPELAGPSSVAPPLPPPVDFWLKVNAELIVYGSTEPGAAVTIGGYPIGLRPDGSFSFRFALPDGAYTLPVVATARHGDQRQAVLDFSRDTRLVGEVGTEPGDPALQPPLPEHTA
jgi:hypothetical protein